MTDRNWTSYVEMHDIAAAFTLLTRIPLPVDHERTGARAASAAWAYPIVGAVLGLFAGGIASLSLLLGAPETMAAALALGILAIMTGAMHEDGLADCADGLGGAPDKSRALEIMKDSRVGAFGAVAIGVALIARWGGMLELTFYALMLPMMVVGAVSRLPMVWAMAVIPNARDGGLSQSAGRPGITTALVATGIAVTLAIIGMGLGGILVLIWAGLGSLPILGWAYRRLGGQTGDVLGGAQQCAEIAALASAVAILS